MGNLLATFCPGNGNLNHQNFKSSNARGVAGVCSEVSLEKVEVLDWQSALTSWPYHKIISINRHVTSTSVTVTLSYMSTTLGISGSPDAANAAIVGILRSTMPNAAPPVLLMLRCTRLTLETSTNTSTAILKATAAAFLQEMSRWKLTSVNVWALARRWEMLIQALLPLQGSLLKRFHHLTSKTCSHGTLNELCFR